MFLNPIKLILSLSLSFLLIVLVLLALIIDLEADVKPLTEPNHADIIHIKKTLSPNNPFKHQRPGLKQLSMSEKMLNQAGNMTLQRFLVLPVDIKLEQNRARIQGSYKLPKLPVDFFLNIRLSLVPENRFVVIQDLQIGNLPVPDWLYTYLEPYAIQILSDQFPQYLDLANAMQRVDITPQQATVTYQWNRILARQAQTLSRDILLSPREQQLILVYYKHLGNITRLNFWKKLTLNQILRPMFELAAKRSDEGGNAIEENRALLLTMALISTNVRISHLVKPEDRRGMRNVRFYRLTLLKRRDLMQHFLISAALAVSTNKTLTDTIGLSKEIDDSKGGSGFSFADLLADRAGVRFAEAAIASESSARQLQDFMARKDLLETDFMAPYDHLPEAINELEFKKRYVDISHRKYLFVENELQQRIGSLPLYKKTIKS